MITNIGEKLNFSAVKTVWFLLLVIGYKLLISRMYMKHVSIIVPTYLVSQMPLPNLIFAARATKRVKWFYILYEVVLNIFSLQVFRRSNLLHERLINRSIMSCLLKSNWFFWEGGSSHKEIDHQIDNLSCNIRHCTNLPL